MCDIEKIADYLALNTLVFHGKKFEEAFAMAAELGFKYVEPACIKNYYPDIIDDNFFFQCNRAPFFRHGGGGRSEGQIGGGPL